jgi:hypothetical protein
MEFRLIYEGPLHGQGAKSLHKWEIRRALHPQLQRLWREHPLKNAADRLLAHPALPGQTSVVVEKGGLLFAPLVTQRLNLYAELSVLLFRQQPRGTLITDGGDIDNRLKTLLDGLRVPHGSMEGRTELPEEPDPLPFFLPAGRRLAGLQGHRRVRTAAAPGQTRRGGGHHLGACQEDHAHTREYGAVAAA